jgi:hypothetical protein
MAQDVFISYATDDRQVAENVCAALEAGNIKCWIAPRDVPYGADYEEAIIDGIASSRLFVLVLSSHSNASPHVKREIQYACSDESGRQIVPLRIEDIEYNKALRYYLGSCQWLDALTPPLEQHLGRLVEHVRSHLARAGDAAPVARPAADTDARTTPTVTETPRPPDALHTNDVKGSGRKLPLATLVVAGVGALLLVALVVALFAMRGRSGDDADNTPPRNVNVNVNASPTPQRTPAPTPTPNASPTPSPRQPLRNVNLSRNLNLRRVR